MKPTTKPVRKLVGRDCELSNYLRTAGRPDGRPEAASRLILSALSGHPRSSRRSGTRIECGRRWRSDALASVYIDQDHIETNGWPTDNPLAAGLQWFAQLAIAQKAVERLNAVLPPTTAIVVQANNSDGITSWGNHLNFLCTRELFRAITGDDQDSVGFLASFISSAFFTGSGMVGAANDKESCLFQRSQRADWMNLLLHVSTMHPDRSFINQRNEPHAGCGLARFHHITWDTSLSPTSNVLAFGTMAIVLSMLERNGVPDANLNFEDPLGQYSTVSRDLRMQRSYRMMDGKTMTVVEHQRAVAEMAAAYVAGGNADGLVRDAREVVRLWLETIDMAEHGDIEALAGRTDWALKYQLLDRRLGKRGLSFRSAEAKALDLLFSNIDPRQGLFFLLAREGLVERMPSEAAINAAEDFIPQDSRGYLMSELMQRYGDRVIEIDWSWMDFKTYRAGDPFGAKTRMHLGDPRRFGRDETETLFARCSTLEELIDVVNESSTAADDYAASQEPFSSSFPS